VSAGERYSASWLSLREEADAQARAGALAAEVARGLAGEAPPSHPAGGAAPQRPAPGHRHVVHDLGCGTGSMGRWLAPHLPGAQHWVLRDRDDDLLGQAVTRLPRRGGSRAPVTVAAQQGDVTALTATDLEGACLVTASALLDLLTAGEVRRLAAACAGAGATVLFTLSVAGRVELTPGDPLDAAIGAAFNAHQRRETGGRRLLGPDATAVAAEAFTALGARVRTMESPWWLGPGQAALTAEWLHGWTGAAAEAEPALDAGSYLRRRLAQARAGQLKVMVAHQDLLASAPGRDRPGCGAGSGPVSAGEAR
jgi:hypothetical protein